MIIVSVPLRGSWFWSVGENEFDGCSNKVVSVPLRGSWFWSLYSFQSFAPFRRPRFRPLTGKLVLITTALARVMHVNMQKVSVPLRGSWFWSYSDPRRTHREQTTFPSPYGEVGFDHGIPENCISFVKSCFRPLTGKLVLIQKWLRKSLSRGLESFRPLTGKLVLILWCCSEHYT